MENNFHDYFFTISASLLLLFKGNPYFQVNFFVIPALFKTKGKVDVLGYSQVTIFQCSMITFEP